MNLGLVAGFLLDVFCGAFKGRPKDPVWEWADRSVFFSEKMAAETAFFDSSMTPWTREWQDLPRQPGVHEGDFMKSSQTGVTEGTLNIIRWMPDHWPGNVGYVINSIPKAKRISKVRLKETLRECAEDQISEDPNDSATHHMILKNMEITVTGSGSASAFRETWYRLGVLDEPEDHEVQADGTTSYDNIQGRFTTVKDGLLLVLGKPQERGGIIHRCWLKGSQEKFLVPCPRCGDRIELLFDQLQFSHCRDLVGQWDLKRVVEETSYRCQLCDGTIHESEKREMVNAGIWVPTPLELREKLEGKSVLPEPGVRSFHISDVYSLFPGVKWGILAKKWLMAFKVAPSITAQNAFSTEHLGRPIEPRETAIRDDAIEALRGGRVEEVNGKKVTLGHRFELVWENHEQNEGVTLPIANPDYLSITGDRQGDGIVFVVFCWSKGGEAYPVDYGFCEDEDHFYALRHREYPALGGEGTYKIFGGLIDSGYQRGPIWEMTNRAIASGWFVYPSRGEGWNSEFKGKLIRLHEGIGFTQEGDQVDVWCYFDHGVKMDFYMGKIRQRSEPRLWMPDPVPQPFITQLTSERLVMKKVGDRSTYKFVHKEELGPNDIGDCFKKQYVFRLILAEGLKDE